MIMKKYLVVLVCFLCLFSLATRANDKAASEPLTLEWLDLIPKDERNKAMLGNDMLSHDGGAAEQSQLGNTRAELNNKLVKIPGFVIPLEGDDEVTTEFLLVPYFGACIHVPPPPPNQIIYVKFPQGAPLAELWDVVNVVGTLKTTMVDHELAQVGYVMEGIRIEPYEDPEAVDPYEPQG